MQQDLLTSRSRNIVVVDGQAYDLTDFANKHPGGSGFIIRSRARDITVTVNTYHKNLEKVKAVLKKYHIGPAVPKEHVDPYCMLPKFLLPKAFSHETLPVYQFDKSTDFQRQVITAIDKDKQLKQKIKKMDRAFNLVTCALVVCYVLLLTAFLLRLVNPWLCAVVFAIVRTALASAGHYGIHQAPNWHMALFDTTYVGYSLVAVDGHTLIHHSYTDSLLDVKRTFFTGMLNVPSLWRFPLHTLHRFAVFMSGMTIRSLMVTVDGALVKAFTSLQALGFLAAFWFVRILLVLEFVAAWKLSLVAPWFLQFAVTLWFNMILIVSSHELVTNPEEIRDTSAEVETSDWGLGQVQHAGDLVIAGNEFIDCFLSAGLSCHRVHHLLPFQKTGFANIACVPLVKKMSEERGVKWQVSKNLWVDKIPATLRFMATTPMRASKKMTFWEENFSMTTVKTAVWYIWIGILGEGAL